MTDIEAGTSPPSLVGNRGVPAIGDAGRAACELPAGEPPDTSTIPDHALSEFSTSDLEIRAASIRGLMHRHRRQPRQDAFAVAHDQASDTTVVVVCDGVGSLGRSHEAAAFVVDRLPPLFWKHRDWTAAVEVVNAQLQALVDELCAGLDPAEQQANGMATTLVAAAISPGPDGRQVRIVRSDDSTVWALSPDGVWTAVSVNADLDSGVDTGAVRALPAASPRLHHAETTFVDGALFVMTDGVDGPLRGADDVRHTLAGWWTQPPTIFDFGSQVGFARKTHLDDRTVVGVWATDRVGP